MATATGSVSTQDAFPQGGHISQVLYDYLMRDVGFRELRELQAKQPAALDFCTAPGGFVAYLLQKNPKCTVDAFSLPPDQGGHEILIKYGESDPRVRVCFADITMFADQFGIKKIAEDHPERLALLQTWPYEPRSYDLVLCDGQVLRTQPLPDYRKACEATRLTNAQLFLGLKMVKIGGTIIMLLHRAYTVQCFRLIHMFDSFSEVQLHKSSRFHKERSSFYLIAKNIRSESMQASKAIDLFERRWKKNTFQYQGSNDNGTEGDETENLQESLDKFGPRFVDLARPIWQTQATALRKAKWMKT